jgi:hypothetical protein
VDAYQTGVHDWIRIDRNRLVRRVCIFIVGYCSRILDDIVRRGLQKVADDRGSDGTSVLTSVRPRLLLVGLADGGRPKKEWILVLCRVTGTVSNVGMRSS